ncbi:MAG: NADPH:quinone reductase, partial [Terriglobia bacterium]
MKAIRIHSFGGPEVMAIEDAPDLRPGAGEVTVRIKAVGVNPVDTYIRSGQYAHKPNLPYTPGSDAAGLVEAAGSGVKSISPGDRVYVAGTLSGAYAEMALCKESQVHRLPANVSFQQGAAVGVPYSTAWRALFLQAHALPGETVLVHGASGGVGVAAVQIARAAGLNVIGTAGTESGLKLVKDVGAHHVLNHHMPNYRDQLASLTGGRGVDVIIEMLANVNLGHDLPMLAKKGRVVVVGSRGPIEINPRDIMSRDASILAGTMMNASEADLATIHAALVAGLDNG